MVLREGENLFGPAQPRSSRGELFYLLPFASSAIFSWLNWEPAPTSKAYLGVIIEKNANCAEPSRGQVIEIIFSLNERAIRWRNENMLK